ncbi:MFS transporter [Salinibacterium soli]|uniref:MFS transporter n=1 Tax=Antiquaquibacter soli TaxID=3064523 RepID=A0ABT9BJZ1_9MICO|nr:MFS transporter [Protaetiibacter sp. WY-16]MDO7881343.1 MFS transporter [Protaetiibacter sp. WY-16]
MAITPDANPATMPIAVAMQRPAWKDTFSALRMHNYRLYVVAQFLSNTAGWMQRIATDWLVLELTGSVALVGLTIAIQFVPTLLLGAWAGVIADRFPKRAVLLLTQGLVGALSLVLAVLAITGAATLVSVYALVLGIGLVQVFDGPARSVFVNEMVGPRHLRNAISVNASIFHLGALLGPALSGALIVVVGSGWAIAINVGAAAIGIGLLLAMRRDELLVGPRAPSTKGQIREAGRYILGKPALFWTMVIVGVVAVFGVPMPTLLAGIADTVYDTGAQGYGLYNTLTAVGALTGALVSARRSSLRLRTIVLGVLLYGVLLALAGLAPFYPMFLVVLVTVGFSRLLVMTAAETMVQFSSNLAIRGRVMSFWVIVLVGGQAIGGPLVGWIAETIGPKNAMIVCGAIPALAAIAISLVLARSGRLTVAVRPRRGNWVAIVPRAASGR